MLPTKEPGKGRLELRNNGSSFDFMNIDNDENEIMYMFLNYPH